MTPRTEDLHIAIREIADKHDITVKQLVNRTGYQKTTIYDFLSGRAVTLPLCLTILTCLWELTGDQELLLTGRREAIAIIELPDAASEHADIKIIAEHTRRFSSTLDNLSEMYSDGKIDGNDKDTVAAYGKNVDDLIIELIKSKHAIQQTLLNNTKNPPPSS